MAKRPVVLNTLGPVPENRPGAVVGTLSLDGADPSEPITFSLAAGGRRFEIDGSTLRLKPQQILNYEATEAGIATLRVKVTDGGGRTYGQTLTFQVADENDRPTGLLLSNTRVEAGAAGAVVGTLSALDPDAGDSHRFVVVRDERFEVVGDTLRLRDGVALGEEAVSVTVRTFDAGGLARAQSFLIEGRSTEQPPVGLDQVAAVVEDAAPGVAVGNLLAGASDPNPGDVLRVTQVAGSTAGAVAGTYGTLSWDGTTGAFTYALDNARAATNALAAGVPATDSFAFTIADGRGGTDTRTLAVTVTGADDAATDIGLSWSAVPENTPGGGIGYLSVVDPDIGDTHAWSVSDARFEVVGTTLTLKAGIALDYESEPAVALIVTATGAGGAGLATSKAFTIAVGDVVENSPPFANVRQYVVDEDTTIPIDLIASAGDPDGYGDLAGFSIVSGPAHGRIVDFEPVNGTGLYIPDANYYGTDSFTWRITDLGGQSATASVNIALNSVFDWHVAVADSYTVGKDLTLTVSAANGVLANDILNDATSLTAAGPYAVPQNGTAVLNADGSFTYTPSTGFVGTDSFTYLAFFDAAYSGNTVSITVENRDLPPVASDGSGVLAEDTTQSFDLQALGLGYDPEGGPLEFNVASQAGYGSVTIANGVATYTPNANFNGTDRFEFYVRDAGGAQDVGVFGLVVTPVNDLPVAVDDPYTVTAGGRLVVGYEERVLANDIDPDTGAPPNLATLFIGPYKGTLLVQEDGSLLGPAGTFTYVPLPGESGEDTFEYVAWDAFGFSNTATVTITIIAAPDNLSAVA